jgi:hypothetical protein
MRVKRWMGASASFDIAPFQQQSREKCSNQLGLARGKAVVAIVGVVAIRLQMPTVKNRT